MSEADGKEKSKNGEKLKPVTFVKGYNYFRNNKLQQNLLLKAMTVSDDPNEWRKMAGLRSMTDLHRTMDKLAIRNEYHAALSRQGISLDKIVDGIKNIAEGSGSDAVRLKGYQTLLRSLGLERYEEVDERGKGWEDLLIKESEKKNPKIENNTPQSKNEIIEYEVKHPKEPKEETNRRAEEKKIGDSLYE